MPLDEDAPLELLWVELRNSPLWARIEATLLLKRDRMVGAMVSDRPKASDDAGMAYAAHQRKLGYIEALNVLAGLVQNEHEKAAKAAKETT
jgi:hypothetical protein